MTDYTPLFPSPVGGVTFTASAAVTGGQLVEVTGDRTVGPAAAGSLKAIGHAGHDAPAGGRLTVHLNGAGVQEGVASGAIAAGALLKAAAAGAVATGGTGDNVVGIALAAAANAATVPYLGK